MPRPALRSRSIRRVKRVTPSGKPKVFYKRRKPKGNYCSECKKPLNGVPIQRPYRMKIAKSKKRPNRPYGGNLCSGCMRESIKNKFIM